MKRMKLFSLLSIIILVVGLIVVPAMTTCQAATTPNNIRSKDFKHRHASKCDGLFLST